MDCRQVHQSFGKYLKKQLPQEEIRQIQHHIEDCLDCHLLDATARRHYLEAHQVLVESR